MSIFLEETIKYLIGKNDPECITQGLKIIKYILSLDEDEIFKYFPWFEKMPSPYRQTAIRRTKNMLDMAIEGNKIKSEFKPRPWEGAKGNDLITHKKILAAIILSQCNYHYDILHELRLKNEDFVQRILDLFGLEKQEPDDILQYARDLYLPGQIERRTAPEVKKDEYVKKLENYGYKDIIDSRARKGKHPGDGPFDKGKIIIDMIWHYSRFSRNILPDDNGNNGTTIINWIEETVKETISKGKIIEHIALHRQQGNIFDQIFTNEVKNLSGKGFIAQEAIKGYLWQIRKNKSEPLNLVLRKESIKTSEGKDGHEEFILLEPYIGKTNFFEQLKNVRNFPGINSEIQQLSIFPKKISSLEKQAPNNSGEFDKKRMVLKLIEAIVASTFKARKFNFDEKKEIRYYDYYYLPYPVLKYIFGYFSCFDVHNEWFATVEFKREDFRGHQEGDLWITVPDLKEIDEYFKEDVDKEVTTLIRLLKSIVYRYLLLTISLLSVSVGFKCLLIRVMKKEGKASLDKIGIEDNCLKTIGENIGCLPLYTKYISDFQYTPSQVRLKTLAPGMKLALFPENYDTGKWYLSENDLYIGVDIGGTNTKFRFFEYKDKKLTSILDLFSFKTMAGKDKDDHYSSANKFVEYLVDNIGKKCKEIGKTNVSYNNIYVGISFPGPVFENQLAGISGLVRKLDKDLISIPLEKQIEDSHIDLIQKKVEVVEPFKEKLKEQLPKCGISYDKGIYINMTNDGTAEGIGNLHKYWEELNSNENGKKNGETIENFDYIIVLKAGTGTAGAVLKKELSQPGQKEVIFTLEEGPNEFGKLSINTMRRPRSFEIDDSDNISSYIIGSSFGGWPGLNEYISQRGLNHLLKFRDNEEMYGKLKDFTSEDIGKIIENTGNPYHEKAKNAAERLGYIIADTLATIKIIYRIEQFDKVGVIISGGVLPVRKENAAKERTGDIVIKAIDERLENVHSISLLDKQGNNPGSDTNLTQWELLKVSGDEPELGCRGSVIYSFYKQNPPSSPQEEETTTK
jgi:hypothetical protein